MHVYFVSAPSAGLIKIGRALCAVRRFDSLRSSSPVPLTMLGAVPCHRGGALEGELHDRFAALRSHGEWFRESDELLTYIAKHAQPPRRRADARDITEDRRRRRDLRNEQVRADRALERWLASEQGQRLKERG